MQCINEIFGGQTVQARKPMHGKTSLIYHRYHAMFERTPSPFIAARYHSLVADLPPAEVSDDLIITAWTEDEVIMGIAHTTLPLYGIQFHPESFLTQYGFVLIENFLKLGPLKIPRYSTDEGKLHG
jgi:anthranilate synthase component 2